VVNNFIESLQLHRKIFKEKKFTISKSFLNFSVSNRIQNVLHIKNYIYLFYESYINVPE